MLTDYAAADPALLVELVKDADPKQYGQLIGRLGPYRAEAEAGMRQELAPTPPALPEL